MTSPSGLERAAADRPSQSPRSAAQSQELLAVGVAMIAGFVDAYGIITYGVYVSFMSGNTTQTGFRAAEGEFGPAAASALAILFFVGGSFAGTLLIEFAGRRPQRLLFSVVAVVLAAIIGFRQLGALSASIHIAAAGFAMGVMNAAQSRVGAQSVSLTFVTGTLSSDRIAFRAGAQARVPPGCAGTVGYALAPGASFVARVGRVPCRRLVVGGGDAAVWRFGSVVSGVDPVRDRGIRSSCRRDALSGGDCP